MPRHVASSENREVSVQKRLEMRGEPGAALDAAGVSEPGRSAKIARLAQVPEMYRGPYLKALSGSRAQAVKAMCLECLGWRAKDVRACTSYACPLWAVRPYQVGAGEEPEPDQDGSMSAGPADHAPDLDSGSKPEGGQP